ncbi:TlpA disulfide reductase family protein [Clostridium sp. CTA-7]
MNNKKRLITIVISLVLLLVIVKLGYNYLSEDVMPVETIDKKGTEETKKAPDIEVYNEAGETIKLSDYKGKKPVIINIWASWCGPCKSEMPYFEKAMKKYSDDVEILMINLTDGQRETKEKALKYIKENNFDMNILFDEKLSAANAYRVRGIPRTILIDIDGNIVVDKEGAVTETELNNYIKKLIK